MDSLRAPVHGGPDPIHDEDPSWPDHCWSLGGYFAALRRLQGLTLASTRARPCGGHGVLTHVRTIYQETKASLLYKASQLLIRTPAIAASSWGGGLYYIVV